jgi:hypothetical protein
MGKIADILQASGDLEEALRIPRDEELPVFDPLGEVRERSVTLQKIAVCLIEGGGIQQGRIREIYDALAESYAIARKLRIPDGVAAVGISLAQVLALGGHREQALQVLDEDIYGFDRCTRLPQRPCARQRLAARAPGWPAICRLIRRADWQIDHGVYGGNSCGWRTPVHSWHVPKQFFLGTVTTSRKTAQHQWAQLAKSNRFSVHASSTG